LQDRLNAYQQQQSRIEEQQREEVGEIAGKLVRTEEKLQAEAQARVDAEQRLRAEMQAKDQLDQELKRYVERLAEVQEIARSEANGRVELERKLAAEAKARAETSRRAPVDIAELPRTEALQAESTDIRAKTGTCECCSRSDISENKLVRIDSGQLFCPQCLHALRSSGVS
jgi:hypothetical protein